MWYGYMADALAAIHLSYVAFVLLGQVAILVGAALGWSWVRNFWFRVAHLVAITIVGAKAIWGINCPLTVWENELRQLAGQSASDATFVGRFLDKLLFVDVPVETLNLIHIGFAILVIATFWFIPPRWPKMAARIGCV